MAITATTAGRIGRGVVRSAPAKAGLFFAFAVFFLAAPEGRAAPLFDTPLVQDGGGGGYQPISTVLSSSSGISVQATVQDASSGLIAAPGSAATNLSAISGTIGLWHFDDNGGTTLSDAAGAHPGTLQGSPTWGAGDVNYGLQFNGTSQYVSFPQFSGGTGLIGGLTNYTIEVWVKWSGTSGTQVIYDEALNYNNGGSWYDGINLQLVNGVPKFCSFGFSSYCLSAPSSLANDGQWHHLAAVFSGGNSGKIYADGAQVASGGLASNFQYYTYNYLYVTFARQANGTNYFSGSLDELRLLNFARAASDVLADYQQGHSVPGYAAKYTTNGGATWTSLSGSNLSLVPVTTAGTNNTNPFYLTASGIYATQCSSVAGMNQVQLTATNNAGASTTQSYNLTVQPPSVPQFLDPAVLINGSFVPISSLLTTSTATVRATVRDSCYGLINSPGQAGSDPVIAGTISLWHFDDGSGTALSDATAAHPGTLTNGPAWTGGVLNGALQFNGSNQYVVIQNGNPIAQLGAYTIEAWVKWDGSSVARTIYDESYVWNNQYWYDGVYLSLSNGTPVFCPYAYGSSSYCTTAPAALPNDGKWHHLAAVLSNAGGTYGYTGYLYVDGSQVATNPSAYFDNSKSNSGNGPGEINIGRDNSGSTHGLNYFSGRIDELRILNYSRAASDILADYQQGPAIFGYSNQYSQNAGASWTAVSSANVSLTPVPGSTKSTDPYYLTASGLTVKQFVSAANTNQALFTAANTANVISSQAYSLSVEPLSNLTGLVVSPPSATLSLNQTLQMSADATSSDGATVTGLVSSWSSDSPAVASVSSSGLVAGLSQGTAHISATYGSFSSTATVSVVYSLTAPAQPFSAVYPNNLTASWISGYPAGTMFTAQLSTAAFPNGFAGNLSSATKNAFATFFGLSPGTTYFAQVSTNAAAGPYVSLSSTVTLPGISPLPFTSVFSSSLTANWSGAYFPPATAYTAQLSLAPFPNSLPGNVSSTTANAFATFTNLSPFTTYYAQVYTLANGPFTSLGSMRTLAVPGNALAPSQATIYKGQTQQFAAVTVQSDGSNQPLNLAGMVWSVDNTRDASVDAGGLATGLYAGRAVVTATSGTVVLSAVLTINDPNPLTVSNPLAGIGAPASPIPTVFSTTGTYVAQVTIQDAAVNEGLMPPAVPMTKFGGTAGLWHFDEGSGGTTADASENGSVLNLGFAAYDASGWTDTSGHYWNGAWLTPTAPSWAPGPSGFTNALSFNGSTTMMGGNNFSSLVPSISSGMTVEFWVNISSTNRYFAVWVSNQWRIDFDYWGCGLNPKFHLGNFAVNGTCVYSDIGYGSNGGLIVGQWNHVAATYDGIRMKLYVNGDLLADDSGGGFAFPAASPNSNIQIGADWGKWHSFNYVAAGTIDDLRVISGVLPPQQIAQDSGTQPIAWVSGVYVNGAPIWSTAAVTTASIGDPSLGPFTLTTSPGWNTVASTATTTNQIRFVAADYSGNISSPTYNIVVDTSPPVSLYNPGAALPGGAYLAPTEILRGLNNVTARLTVRDRASGLDPSACCSAQYTTNGGTDWNALPPGQLSVVDAAGAQNGKNDPYVLTASGLTLAASAAPGTNQIRFTAVDRVGGSSVFTSNLQTDVSSPTFPTQQVSQDDGSTYTALASTVLSTTTGVVIQAGAQDDFSGIKQIATAGPLWQGAVGMWRFDENGGSTAYDAAGNGNTMALTGNVYGQSPWLTPGKFGPSALYFNSHTWSIPYSPSLAPAGQLTIEFWYYANGSRPVLWFGQGNPSYSWGTYYGYGGNYNSNYFPFTLNSANGNLHAVTYGGFPSQWSHVAIVYDGLKMTLYVNGTLAANDSYAANVSSQPIANYCSLQSPCSIVWGQGVNGDGAMRGYLDELRIYNVALSTSQIALDAAATNSPAYSVQYTTNSGAGWIQVPNASVALTTTTSPFQLAASGLNFVKSSIPAANRIAFNVSDNAGNVQTSTFNVQVAALCTYPGSASNPFIFTDATLTPHQSVIRAAHVNELRNDINALRSDANLSGYLWSDPQSIAPHSTVIRAAYFTEMRNALNDVYIACGQALPAYSDPAIIAGTTTIRTSAITDLRTAVLNAK